WSLESSDPNLVCNTCAGWEFATDRSGGTPGRLNSVDADLVDDQAPVFLYFGYGEPCTIQLHYSEPVLYPGEPPGQVTIQPGALAADSVVAYQPLAERLTCYFPMDPAALPDFRIHVPGVPDCQGNLSHDLVLPAGAFSAPTFGSVLINEIMYDPLESTPEYIELYNQGPRFFDLADLAVGVAEGTYPEKLTILSSHSRNFGPGEYLVLCRDIRHLRDAYGLEISGCWMEVDDLSSLPNTGGTVYLTERSGNTVDVADYGDRMHMELIGDTRGISLERIAWDRPGFDTGNWHSAASIEGYATPGRANSQALDESGISGILVLEPQVFSPDNDGYNDLLGISLSTLEQGSVIRLWITDLAGNPVRSLANNHITGSTARYVWDGEQDNGEMAREGIYVVHLRGYHPVSGRRWNRKTATGVIYH
ncbi:MAG: lamin tail domain-containing protein, partial [Bacteroidales bacterium]|nr:lamin tail domain-containing protein [Bacteroidales bacterium]